ncbi:MAG: hypothetical protein R6U67_16260 [Sodalinema sp.]|uniref:hypothetical protein n=1 Tax=Sodalinema sp. TaxID=3080550 RepID=UPI00396F5DA6
MNANRLLLISFCTLLVSLSPSLARQAQGWSPRSNTLAQVSTPTAWQTFQSTEGRFEVMVPKPPERMQQRVDLPGDSISLYAFASEDTSADYLISYADYPQEFISRIGEPSEFLDAVKEGFLGGIEAQDVVTQSRRLQGYPGLVVEYMTPDGASGYAHFYLVNDRLYQVMVTSQRSDSDNWQENAQRFLTSFNLR